MPFASDQKEEVKSRTDIVQLISEYIPVKKAGVRFVANCPFHHEKTPSFSISPDSQFWYCFGCGEGGDAFGFVMRMEGLDFPDALRLLARKAGIVLREENRELSTERARLQELNALAARFWHEVLMRQPAGARALAYCRERRRLTDQTLEDWQVGYAPDSWDATLKFLKSHGYTEEELFKAGLVLRSERTGNLFDRFRGRVMFPIRDVHGHTVGCTARVMPGPDGKDPAGEPKYMNTPQTPLYDKSRVVFGLDKARHEIRKANLAVLVEGNLDVIASHQAGVTNVVAASGTALTKDHLTLLQRYASRIALVFDYDKAGEKAFERVIDMYELCTELGLEIYVVDIPAGSGKDADEIIKKDPEVWKRATSDVKSFLNTYLARVKAAVNWTDENSRWDAAQKMLTRVAVLPSEAERALWVTRIGDEFKADKRVTEALFHQLGQLIWERNKKALKGGIQGAAPVAKSVKRPRGRHEVLSESLVALLVRWPELQELVLDRLSPDELSADVRPLYTDLVLAYNKQRSGEVPSTGPAPEGPAATSMPPERRNVLMLLAEKEADGLTEETRRETVIRLIGGIKELHKAQRRRDLTEAMADAERRGDSSAIEKISEQLNELLS